MPPQHTHLSLLSPPLPLPPLHPDPLSRLPVQLLQTNRPHPGRRRHNRGHHLHHPTHQRLQPKLPRPSLPPLPHLPQPTLLHLLRLLHPPPTPLQPRLRPRLRPLQHHRPPNAIPGQFFGLFSNSTSPSPRPLLAVEFDTGRNTEFNDPDENHVGIDLNNPESVSLHSAGYFSSNASFVPIDMKSGQNIRAWIDFDPTTFQINVTIAPITIPRPSKALIAYRSVLIKNYVSPEMFVGFSASKVTWVEAQRVLAWSLSDSGVAREINTSNLPVFEPESKRSRGLSGGGIAGVSIGGVGFLVVLGFVVWGLCWWWRRRVSNTNVWSGGEDDEIEEWELEYWPHRFSHEELVEATRGFSSDELLGSGGFGRVYRATLRPSSSSNDHKNNNNTVAEVAVKCVSHDSKQGFREFMAEISSVGRLQHKNLVQMRGWCRKSNELMLVYDYMPNGSLNKWIFDKPKKVLNWEGRRRVLIDVAEGLSYLHHGWDQVVLHRDIKSSNILLDSEMRARLGDFGLAKLYQHGQAPNTTRVVGTLGYLAPELANVASPTAASDVYSFGVVVLEVVCGKRPIDTWSEDEPLLIDRVRDLYEERRLSEGADERIAGEYKVEEMEIVMKLGLACCHPDPSHRPTMKDVVAVLIGRTRRRQLPLVYCLSFALVPDLPVVMAVKLQCHHRIMFEECELCSFVWEF
ncbi:hypothetical protein Syun_020429 [Stephania yunnanensis]|uniref:non-specific serine/threonine protein kinase n=1 Tax=Stephania yunnanensis TaxID=152371 RepID=A0AAP0NN63_9MAGN